MDAIECLKTRRSIRAYLHTPVPRAIVEDIVDCGRLAASAINIQPWLFVAVEDDALRRQLADLCDYGRFIADAPLCIVVFCRNVKYFVEDGSAATQNILNAARAHGLGSCWVAGHQKAYACRIQSLLNVPEEYLLVSLVAIGYPAEDRHPEKRPLAAVLRWNRY
ncbi:MAG: nitroreductase family protein [Planctomycetes bacterium]|nr:nitroreductase family protein [Planctomycetota bacterium]